MDLMAHPECFFSCCQSANSGAKQAVPGRSSSLYGGPVDRGGGIRRDEKLLDIKSIRAAVIRLVHLPFLFLFLFFY